jgi:hypothetical protein
VPDNARDSLRTGPGGDDPRRRDPSRRGARQVSAILPNGKVVWLRVAPELAPAASLRDAADAADEAAQSRAVEAAVNAYGIRRLATTLTRDVRTISGNKLDRLERLRRESLRGDERVAKRLSKARDQFRATLAKQMAAEQEAVDRLARRDLWDKIVVATSLPLFAAYGEKGNPFGTKNLALTVALLVFLVGDEIRDLLFGSEDRSPAAVREMDAWSYLAPLANLLAGWWLMSDFQHERFITGSTREFERLDPQVAGPKVRHQYVSRVNLSRVMPPGHFNEFAAFERVPAVATLRLATLSPAGVGANAVVEGIRAEVRDGFLELRVSALADGIVIGPSVIETLEVAWMVDTQKPEAALP